MTNSAKPPPHDYDSLRPYSSSASEVKTHRPRPAQIIAHNNTGALTILLAMLPHPYILGPQPWDRNYFLYNIAGVRDSARRAAAARSEFRPQGELRWWPTQGTEEASGNPSGSPIAGAGRREESIHQQKTRTFILADASSMHIEVEDGGMPEHTSVQIGGGLDGGQVGGRRQVLPPELTGSIWGHDGQWTGGVVNWYVAEGQRPSLDPARPYFLFHKEGNGSVSMPNTMQGASYIVALDNALGGGAATPRAREFARVTAQVSQRQGAVGSCMRVAGCGGAGSHWW